MPLESTEGPIIRLEPRHVVLSSESRIYAMSDSHGFSDVLKASLDIIDKDVEKNPLCNGQGVHVLHLGDINDKGPDTRKCIDLFSDFGAALKKNGNARAGALIGNHEWYLINFLNGPQGDYAHEWVQQGVLWIGGGGGLETIKSYGIECQELEPFKDLKNRIILTRKEICARDLQDGLARPMECFLRARERFLERTQRNQPS